MFNPTPNPNSPQSLPSTHHQEQSQQQLSHNRPCEELNTPVHPPVPTEVAQELPPLSVPFLQLLLKQGADKEFLPIAYSGLARLFVDEIPENRKKAEELISELPSIQKALYAISFIGYTPKAIDTFYNDSAVAMRSLLGILVSHDLVRTISYYNSVPFPAQGMGLITASYAETGIQLTAKGLQLLKQTL